jgi:hypothetical protein
MLERPGGAVNECKLLIDVLWTGCDCYLRTKSLARTGTGSGCLPQYMTGELNFCAAAARICTGRSLWQELAGELILEENVTCFSKSLRGLVLT